MFFVKPPPARFIIVEDSEEDADILARSLDRSGGGGAVVCHTGEKAILALNTLADAAPGSCPVAVFLDVGLPGMGGFELLKWIRQHERWQSLVVVLLSGTDEPRNLGKAAQLGADCYMIKFPPISVMRDLVAEIHRSARHGLPRPVVPITCNLLVAATPR